jgi:serine/threonine protein kinase
MTVMTPERWQKMKGVLYDALELPRERRSEFLDCACSGEDSLRKEVASLLASGDQACSDLLASSEPRAPLLPGTKLEHYEVHSLLGAGGMGEVYRGHDARLGRDVAIKILPRAFCNNPDRLRRFQQEARAAAALNHPNIVAIYDVGTTSDDIPYVVSELLEGETLRQCLMRGPLPVRKTVDLALQIASGLAAAHDKGIIHRDLKPENHFLTTAGHLKILDFGLAKLTSPLGSSSPNAPTLTQETDAGVMMGTVGYMPPEQVRGGEVDQRADIFALGAIIYEMLSGKRAFHGETAADTIEAILNRDPPALSQISSSVPPAFDRVLRRCLEKNANERFHSVRDVAFALEAISDLPSSGTGNRAQSSAGRSASRRRLYAVGGLLAVLAVSFAAAYMHYRATTGASPVQEWEQLTDFPDSAVFPALSPDGRMLAFLRGADTFITSGDLYLKLLPQGEPVQLTHDGTPKTNPGFSPDGSRITYSVVPAWDTWVVPVLGGKTQLMLPNASGLAWVDDQHILFSEIKSGIHMAIVTATESRGEERDIYIPAQEDGMAHHSYLSPDRKWVLIATEMTSAGMMPCRLVPFDRRSSGEIVGPRSAECTHAGWSPDGKSMFFSANAGNGFHLWRQAFPHGNPEQITFGPTEQDGLAVAPDGRSVLTSVGLMNNTVWVHDKKGDRQVPFEGSARLMMGQGNSRAIFSPDSRKLFFLGRKNPKDIEELWAADLTSGLIERPLPGTSVANSFDLSDDGKQIAFDSFDTKGESHLWVASLDRRTPPRRLDSDSTESNPLFGHSGDLFFLARSNGSLFLFRRPLDGGPRKEVIPHTVRFLQTLSADGKWVVAEVPIEGEEVTRGVVAYNLDDGIEKRVCNSLCIVRWTGDGKFLYVGLPGAGAHSGLYKTFIVPLRDTNSFPELPSSGIKTEKDLTGLGGVKVISELARPGPDGSLYGFDRSTPHRNIFRIPIR